MRIVHTTSTRHHQELVDSDIDTTASAQEDQVSGGLCVEVTGVASRGGCCIHTRNSDSRSDFFRAHTERYRFHAAEVHFYTPAGRVGYLL
ncbi:hypothetical protein BaRGS_00006729 [Batillaria attramentaria]|uniref:Uncharacterized protein n=1 Tax=Batillaria attramentaria TaxID=370345 RepID=A0ABD0LRA7_9CAEN